MKLTLAERIGNMVSFGAVVKWKLEAMQWETTSKHWQKMCMNESSHLEKYMDDLEKRNESLRTIASMGTPSMAHIGKKMQAEALKGLGQ